MMRAGSVRQRPMPDMVEMTGTPLQTGSRELPRFAGSGDWRYAYTAATVAVDLLAAGTATTLALLLRFGGAPNGYTRGSIALVLSWVAVVALNRTYEHRFIGVGAEEFTRTLRAGVTVTAVVAFASYITKAQLARGYVLIAVPTMVGLALLGRCVLRTWLYRQRRCGRCVQRTLLVGSAAAVRMTADRLHSDTTHGMVVVGACVKDCTSAAAAKLGPPVLGDLADVQLAAVTARADVVAILPSALLSGAELRRLAWSLEPMGAELIVCSGLIEIAGARISVRPVANSPMLHVTRARLSGPSRAAKATFDRTGALMGLVLVAPVLLVISLLIWAGDRRSPLFRQTRVGLNGREFTLYKLRTMVPDAEQRQADLSAHNENDGVLFKMSRDPRVTPIGRWLRRYSLDELPQLVNVVCGQMSLVGPRPPLPKEACEYGDDMRRRLLVKPGLTGLWQVSGRSDLPWAQAQLLDLRYVENWSLGFDLVILCRTARAVLSGSGAY